MYDIKNMEEHMERGTWWLDHFIVSSQLWNMEAEGCFQI
jgi:hypothetical protein